MLKRSLKLKIDSREQKPLKFREGAFDAVVVEGLPFGDYWAELDGKELPIVFERKGFGDLFGTMTSGYKRFKKEMEKAEWANCTLILLVEGNMRKVAQGYDHSKFGGDSMLKKLAMMRVRHDLEFHFFNDRGEMARFIEEIFNAVKRDYKNVQQVSETSAGGDVPSESV